MHLVRRLGRSFPLLVVTVTALWAVIWMEALGQDGAPSRDTVLRAETYIMPPKLIADAVMGSRPDDNVLYTNMCPDGKKFLVIQNEGMPSVVRMGRPAVHLGEMTFDHTAYRSHSLYVKSTPNYELFFFADKRRVPVQTPARTRVSNPVWSPDGSQLAFYVHSLDSTHIYVANTATGTARKLTDSPVLATLVTNFQWSRDGRKIQTVLKPNDTKSTFGEPATGPMVRVWDGKATTQRTFRYLLETAQDMELLEHITTGQLANIDVETGRVTKIGTPHMIRAVNMSPSADNFRVTTMSKPFNFYQPASTFGSAEGIWDVEGKNLYSFPKGKAGKGKMGDDPPNPDAQKKKDEQPPEDAQGKRELAWRPDGAGMHYLQLEPAKKDAKDSKEPRKDRVMLWTPPWRGTDIKVVYETPHPITGCQYSEDCQILFLTQTVDKQRQIVAVDLKDADKKRYVLHTAAAAGGEPDPILDGPDGWTQPAEDHYGDDFAHDPFEQQKKGGKGDKGAFGGQPGPAGGGNLMTRAGSGQAKVVRISSTEDVYVSGTEKGGAGGKPFIDKINIKTGNKTRIFTAKAETPETIDAVNGNDISVVFTNRQQRTVPPNTFMYDLSSGNVEKLTNNVDRNPWFHEIKTQTIEITREDGFRFKAKVTTSPKVGAKAPAMFWFYPKEFTSQEAYSKGGGKGGDPNAPAKVGGKGGKGGDNAKYASPGPRAMSMLTLLGYAIVEPDCPIVGPAGKMNDNYVKDLRSSLQAVVHELDKRNLIDRSRLGIGGHSYGAFSTANAMIHTQLFKAGIAGDGCYNRTLTPMSFQTEKRNIWEARDTYLDMSPLLWADRLSGALLMYHGAWDANVGTHPINSERMYMALRGLGKPTALYMYPYEGHGPIGKETQLDMWARWVAWLDTYVANPKEVKPAAAKEEKKK